MLSNEPEDRSEFYHNSFAAGFLLNGLGIHQAGEALQELADLGVTLLLFFKMLELSDHGELLTLFGLFLAMVCGFGKLTLFLCTSDLSSAECSTRSKRELHSR